MNLAKVSNAEKLGICKKYFYGGFFFLPFLWMVNAIWFYVWAFRRPRFPEQYQIKRYVIYSGVGSAVWLAGLIIWQIMYQTHRVSWGRAGDDISFFLPMGRL
ncbi:gamma-secretase subunit pen-2-like [Pollicipes pollicipes]|uniref:gamma-secretase subunit pen-2-like n=1 Tax=Pollicipes pollicipes TaxID=41117 RepID=UPI001884BA16|nr:gamma-secretase subunit pen-2-like [Pollicipes pollicipes]